MNHFFFTKSGKFLQANYKLLCLFLCLSILNIFFLCWGFASYQLAIGSVSFAILIAGSLFLEIVLCIFIFIAKSKTWPIEKLFLVLGLTIGITYVFALPISRAPDEESHFFRIYEITTGHIISDISPDGKDHGSFQASNIEIVRDFKENNVKYSDVINNLSLNSDNNSQSFITTSAFNYNPIVYTPHLIGMGIGEALHLPFLVTAYLAKLFNCLFCIFILYFCIKTIPFLKKFIFLIAFFPITMQAMTSLSADGFMTVIAIALITFVLYATYSMKHRFTKRHYALILALCLILSLSKVVYAALCLLLFAIPKERFKNQKSKYITILTVGGICIIALILWFFLSATSIGSANSTNQDILFHNPLMYLAILIKSISTNFDIYIKGTFGGYLEWFNIVLSPIYIFTSLVIFILLCKEARDNYAISRTLRILSIVIFSLITLATFTAMYTGWTKPGETIIDGVQGRYFLPILLLIPLSFINDTKSIKPKSNSKTIAKNTSFSKTSTNHTPLPKTSPRFQQNYYLYGFLIFENIYAITMIACSHL